MSPSARRSSPFLLSLVLALAAVAVSVLVSPVSGQVDVLPLTTRGDLLTRDASNIVRLGVGGNNTVLRSNGTDPAWAQVTLTTDVTGTLPIGNGGTGQTTATAAFNALDPLTTQGDVLYHNGTDSVRLAAGTSGQFLKTQGAGANPIWASATNSNSMMWANGDSGGYNPADTTPFFLQLSVGGNLISDPSTTAATGASSLVPVVRSACTITDAYISNVVLGTLGTGETGTLAVRINNSADTTLINNTLKWDAVSQSYSATGLSIALASGDFFQLKITPPAWATNPTTTFYVAQIIYTCP